MDQLKPKETFILSLLFFNGVPLLPLFIELALKNSVDDKTLILTAAIYPAGLFTCTKNFLLIGIYFFIVVLQFVIFGALADDQFDLGNLRSASIICLICVALSQVLERYKINITDERNFWGDPK